MSEVEMSRLLGEYTEVINRVLSRGGVFYFHPDYEDYRQELNLVLVQWMQKCPTLLHFLLDYPEEKIYQRLLWFLLDLRRQSRKQVSGAVEVAEVAEVLADTQKSVLQALEDEEHFAACWESLRPSQQRQFWVLLKEPQETGFSRSRLSYYRCQLKKSFKNFYPNL
ncbi:hypothetical protein P7G87_06390 [Enterococcus asini]|uniref:hypothetical protein n=1 Tax=Enterococcus asini TaxID=57732 RepID=UPI001386669A|nr:hypothetical protein [Enterococcus asini]MCD5029685.1 hypothetical protein [Enterococcus asini]MDT2784298.1 hypothetical protein [Enterococcus asini]